MLAHKLDSAAWIIPAYAGSTRAARGAQCRRRDHPRVCGEHSGYQESEQNVEGSSPRMRGALLGKRLLVHGTRIIPAYAGSTGC